MKTYSINNQQNLSFKGKFIVKGNISAENKALLERFKTCTEYLGISNERFLRSKPYDIIVKEGNAKKCLFLSANFNIMFDPKNIKKYSENIIHLDNRKQDNLYERSSAFDLYLKEFEYRKEDNNGFNNFWEKLKLTLKYHFNPQKFWEIHPYL